MSLTITALLLEQRQACPDQIALFRATFGESVDVTRDTWARARDAGLDVLWASCLLPNPLRATYNAVRDRHRASHEADYAQLLATYVALCDEVLLAALLTVDGAA